MRAIIVDDQWIYFENITNAEDDILWREFSVVRPGRHAYVDPSQVTTWDGVYRKYNRGRKRIARPLLSFLKGVCTKYGLPLVLIDNRPFADYQPIPLDTIQADFLPGITLDQFQIDAIHKACKVECGIFDITTGGGKGELIAGICKAIPCPTLIVADQRVVIDQLKRRLELRDVAEEIGLFYAGRRPNNEVIVVGSIQSLALPKLPQQPTRLNKETDEHFEKRKRRYELSSKAYKTRSKNAKILQGYAKRAHMVIVDECDKATSDYYKSLFRHWFKGRRRYGFCLVGDSKIITQCGERELKSFKDGDKITLLSHNGISDVWETGTIVYAGMKKFYTVCFNDNSILQGSGDHLIAAIVDNGVNYVRIADIVPGQIVKTRNDTFIDKLETLTDLFSIFDTSFNLSDISWHGFKFSRANFNQQISGCKINDVQPIAIKVISNFGALVLKSDPNVVHELQEQKLVRRCKIDNFTSLAKVMSCSESGLDFQSSTAISFGDSSADFTSDLGIVDGIASVFPFKSFKSVVDLCEILEDNGNTISLNHGSLDSFDHFMMFHRMVNAISLKAGLSSPALIVERLTTISCQVDLPRFVLISGNGKPILYTVLYKHFLFIGVVSLFSACDDVRQFFDTLGTEVFPESFNLFCWTITRALKNIETVITLNRDDIMVSGPIIIPYSLDDHRVSPAICPIYLSNKNVSVSSIVSGFDVEMWDVVDVTNTNNFYANNILVHNSGTPFDDDKPVEAMEIQEHLGSVIFRQTREKLVELGRIIPTEYIMFATGLRGGDIHDRTVFDLACTEWMIDNVEFHQLIVQLCKQRIVDGNLILVEREILGQRLLETFAAAGIESRFIYGKTPKRRRDEALRAFERREFNVLIGGKIINRGLDLAGGCDNLIVASGGKLRSEFMQKVGRALRRNSKGKSKVYDFFWRCNHYLYEHSKARLKTMIAAGYPTKIIFPNGVIDGSDLVKRNFKIPKSIC